MFVKVFVNQEVKKLENVLQDWLDANPKIKIQFITQSQPDNLFLVTVSIFYTLS